MNVNFTYNREQDVICLMRFGKKSNNSAHPTKVYGELVAQYGESPSEGDTSAFIDTYVAKHSIDLGSFIQHYTNDWMLVASEFQKRAESVFKTTLPADITSYLTVNTRCPYDIHENLFFVSVPSASARNVVMHELWHFYTWYGLGIDQEEKLRRERYNECKESLTVLLNIECADLFPEGITDIGYPQHQALRERITTLWLKEKNIHSVWEHIRN